MPQICYKLLKPDMTSFGSYLWIQGKWNETNGRGSICGPGWLHACNTPELAIMLNPYRYWTNVPCMFIAEWEGERQNDSGMKFGSTRMRVMEEIPCPPLTEEQRIEYWMTCVLLTHHEPRFVQWAENWIVRQDRKSKTDKEVQQMMQEYTASSRMSHAEMSSLWKECSEISA